MFNVTDGITYIGVNDKKTDLFEGQYKIPNGISYNSYVIKDKAVAVADTVDASFFEEWSNNLKEALGGSKPDYLIVTHMEPDHSANIARFAELYPDAKLIATAKSFSMMKNFFGKDFSDRAVTVNDGDTVSLGERELKFITAPMVHWPEVAVFYDTKDKILFSADAFGKFGALGTEEEWDCEARRYYFGIVGKYGAQVQMLLKKVAPLEINKICPLHGPILDKDLSRYIELYNTWSSYKPESFGVTVAYSSVYGNTEKAAKYLAEKCAEKGVKVALHDLARTDTAEAVEDAFRYSKLVLATTTYNSDIFPCMRTFIESLTERNYQNRFIAMIENGSWAPMAAKVMKSMLEKSKNINADIPTVTVMSSLTSENLSALDSLADILSE